MWLVLTAFPAGFRGALRIVGKIAGAALLLRTAGLLLLTAVRMLAALLAGVRGALRVVGEVSAAATVFLSHRESPLLLCPFAALLVSVTSRQRRSRRRVLRFHRVSAAWGATEACLVRMH
jgi:hypothetical protein